MDVVILATMRAGHYILVSLGFALVFGSCRILNLMHGAYVMLGAYLAYGLITTMRPASPTSVAGSVILAAGMTGAVGWIIFKLLQVTRRTSAHQILAISVAMNLLAAQTVRYLYGTEGLSVAPILPGSTNVAGVTVPSHELLNPPVAIASVVALWLLLGRSQWGRALRAVADDPKAARLLGVRPSRMLASAVGLSGFLAGLAGAMAAPNMSLSPDMWVQPLLISFAVVVLGGRGSVWGTAASAIVLATTETVTSWLWSEAAAQYVALILIIAGLFAFPKGLAGGPRYDAR